MRSLEQVASDFNVLGDYLALRDIPALTAGALKAAYGREQVDLLILFGGSLPHGCRMAGEAYVRGLCKSLMIVGGEGHTTDHLRREIGKRYPQITVENRMEAEVIADYLQTEFSIDRESILLEWESTNCGENVLFALELLKKLGPVPRCALIMQDSSMQRRMDATFQKVWRGEDTRIINYAAYRARLTGKNGRLEYEQHDIWGMWEVQRYLQLLLGEIPRLTDNEEGYGPKGKGYLAHVDIPQEVLCAYERLQEEYGDFVREPWGSV